MIRKPNCLVLVWAICAGLAGAESDVSRSLRASLAGIDAAAVPSGILIDRVLPMQPFERYDGSESAPMLRTEQWRQLLDQFVRAADGPIWARSVTAARLAQRETGPIPIAVLDLRYEKLQLAEGSRADKQQRPEMAPIATRRLFAAAALRAHSHRGADVTFVLAREWYLSAEALPIRIEIDFDDARGFRPVALDEPVHVHFRRLGGHELRLRVRDAKGMRNASFAFTVEALLTPSPDDTLRVTGAPYLGSSASGSAFVLLAPGHATIEQPAIVIEGFDLDDTMNWDELYALLNQENLLEDLRGSGFDTVVLNFDSATDLIQRNGLLVAELLTQIHALSQQPIPLVGASMGGLCARYALCYLESQNIPHGVANFLSFDVPHGGANIPLGIQHWLDFFKDDSAEAAFLLSRLDTPAARQMLVLHHTATSGSVAAADPLRTSFLTELAGLGDHPQQPRKVAIANGSGSQQNQGFAAGAQIIQYVHDTALIDVTGNVWAVSDGALTQIFNGRMWVFLFINKSSSTSVGGTQPWDNAPGGRRNSMAQMDATQAPYGDIVALHPNHCFIPTISALDIATAEPFYEIAADPELLAHTPFDAVYFPSGNQDHVAVTAENKAWFLDEIRGVFTATPPAAALALRLLEAIPNPFNPSTTFRFELSAVASVTLDVFDARGRLVARLVEDELFDAGEHRVGWRPASEQPSGVYRARLSTGGAEASQSVVLLK